MNIWACALIAAVAGAVVGYLQTPLFAALPEKWLQDYGVKETDPDYRPSKRMKVVPHGVISAVFCVAIYVIFTFVCYYNYIKDLCPLHILAVVLSTPVIVIVMMSDRLNRIIPDQCSIALAMIGILCMISDFTEGNMWFSEEAAAHVLILNRVLAALIGGGILWLLNFICMTFAGREGMGQGDMKLLAACGLITGCYGLVVVIYVGIIAAMFFAVPLLIRKRMRIKAEKKEVAEAEDPIAKRAEIARRKAAIHFADDPDYLAFGPFIAFGASVFLAFEPLFCEKMMTYIQVLGLAF